MHQTRTATTAATNATTAIANATIATDPTYTTTSAATSRLMTPRRDPQAG